MYLFCDTDFMISEMSCKTLDRNENKKWNDNKKKREICLEMIASV